MSILDAGPVYLWAAECNPLEVHVKAHWCGRTGFFPKWQGQVLIVRAKILQITVRHGDWDFSKN